MKKSYIIGAGGFAKEVYYLLSKSKEFKEIQFGGFIDYAPEVRQLSVGTQHFDILKEDEFLNAVDSKKVILFVGVGDPKLLKKISEKFDGLEFPNLVADDVHLDSSIILGRGNIITSGVKFTVDTKVGSFNIFNLNATIGHDAVIHNFNVINPLVAISGGVVLGDCNLVGTGASILQYLTIGNNNVIGGNGLLSKNVENDKIMVGVPCKELVRKK